MLANIGRSVFDNNGKLDLMRKSVRLQRNQMAARKFFAVVVVSQIAWTTAEDVAAQRPTPRSQPSNTRPVPPKPAQVPPRKLNDAEKAAQAVLNAYTDAANFQNSGAYALAIDAWQRLLVAYPKDALASKARHYLGICYLQGESPNYEKAIENLRGALQDPTLEVREESLMNFGRALFDSSMDAEPEVKKQRLQESSIIFAKFLENYSDGSFADQALFYAGEAEYQLGRLDKATSLFRRLTDGTSYSKSPMRSDALFSLGVVYDEQKQNKLAGEAYESFLKSYPEHRFVREVRLRLAENKLVANDFKNAVDLFAKVASADNGPLQDYVLYRYGYALAKAGDYSESSAIYRKLSDQFPDSKYSAGASLAAGQALMRVKKYDEAIQYFDRLVPNKDDTSAEAAHLICQIAMMQNRPQEAVKVARDAVEWAGKSPRIVALKMDLAEALATDEKSAAEARSMFEQIAVEHADDPQAAPRATYNVAFAALQSGDIVEARRWSQLFSQRYPQDALAPDVAYIFAESTLQLGQHAEAATSLQQLISGQPSNPMLADWKLRLTHARYIGDELDEAIRLANELIKTSDRKNIQAEAYFLLGASLLKQEKFKAAEDALKQSITESPKWAQADEAHLILAQSQSKQNKVDDAKSTLQKLIKAFPSSRFKQQAEFRLGQLSASTGDLTQALASYDAVISNDRDKSLKDFASYGKAWVLMQQQNYDPAVKLLRPLAVSDRKDSLGAESRLALAVSLRNLGKVEEAVESLETMSQDPSLGVPPSKSLYELGIGQVELKQYEAAASTFKRLLNDFPANENTEKVLYEYAWSLKETNKDPEALSAFMRISKDYPDSPLAAEADYRIGQSNYDAGDFDKAINAYQLAVSRTEDDLLREKSIYKLGWAYFQKKDFEQSAKQFAEQVRAFPNSSLVIESYFMQAECKMKTQQFTDALSVYQKARSALEAGKIDPSATSQQIQSLIYLHGAQAAREVKKWPIADSWLAEMMKRYPESEYKPFALYEQAYSAQNQRKLPIAIELYSQVADNYRNDIGARSRFMLGELYFAERDFAKAVPEFERTMYGYGATQASPDIKNWQARAAIEAGRCSEVLIGELTGQRQAKAVDIAKNFYQFVIEKHPEHELVSQAKTRIAELDRIGGKK